jgi:signal peptidase I
MAYISPTAIYPRRWHLAAALNVFNGTGYLYVGRPFRAVLATLWSFMFLLGYTHGFDGWIATPLGFLTFLCAGLGGLVFFVADAVRIARLERRFELRSYNRWWVYLGWFAAMVGVAAVEPVASLSNGAPIRTFSIPSRSMTPALQIGDYVVADVRAYKHREPELGDVAVFSSPKSKDAIFVKRVVGVPGDTVQMIHGLLHINGTAASGKPNGAYTQPAEGGERETRIKMVRETLPNGRSYDTLDSAGGNTLHDTPPFVVPAGHFFVMGDNRDNSIDSRTQNFGYIPRQNFLGRMVTVFWARDWVRIGTRLE